MPSPSRPMTRTCCSTRAVTGSSPHATGGASGWPSSSSFPRSSASPSGKPELTPRHDDGGATHDDTLDLRHRSVDPDMEPGGPTDLAALAELDRLAEFDLSVPSEVDGERAGGRSGRRVLGDAVGRHEDAHLPGVGSAAGKAADTGRPERSHRRLIGGEGRDLLRGAEFDHRKARAQM